MKVKIRYWFSIDQVILSNTGSLIGTTAITSVFGFFYWWLAARQFPPEAVGLASAAVSAMMLLGAIGVLGLGTLLIGELPRQPSKAGPLITASLLMAGIVSGLLAFLFAIAAPRLSTELVPLTQSSERITLFAVGVALTAISLVLDQALIGLLRGELQLGRNTLFAVAKLIALWVAGIWSEDRLGLTIYATWVFGNLVSLAALAAIVALEGRRIAYRPQWRLLRGFGRTAIGHHGLNLALQVPALALPLVVTILLSAAVNASFFAAWMIAGFAFVVPTHLTTVLYAVGAKDQAALAQKMRMTLRLSFISGLLASTSLFVSAGLILGLFGAGYAEQAESGLRILGLGVFPLIVKTHYVAIRRVYNQVIGAAVVMTAAGALELILAGFGAHFGGLTGLILGWLVAICIEAAFMAPTVFRTAKSAIKPNQQASEVSPPSPSTSVHPAD